MRTTLEKFKFKELKNEIELEKFMRLRYKRYVNSVMKNFININQHEIDIDIYDLKSRHFGLFCGEKPVGYLRLVYPKMEIYQETIFNIGCKYHMFCPNKHSLKNIEKLKYPEFPFISYPNVPDSIQQYYNDITANNEMLLEPSRLMLFENADGINQIKFLTECAVALYVLVCIGKKYAVILNCDARHERFYQRYGFRKIENTEKYHLKGRNSNSSSLLTLALASTLKESPVPKKFHGIIEKMLDEFKKTNQITRII